ncbi:NUDIX hydrolase domain,NUDIX hydrolase domain-like,NUDIX hydrolase, conserved site,7,8-dihydro-8- [Cinara cedri]|uniref:Oxidized purine nucleoside triphosphate hydrolase n=1 Tax=Cinara cedri TaxID=506608 RepID=A0A5E4N7Q5_9HEMI|nr:NUDIX hydrolase domain,NUDIX hydrolase domain-like,NUDIX hydrolase, conserved site,7,8-dihydro-8- [Cinara cedri]
MLPYPVFEGYSRKLMTLTMILKNNEILLGMKNRGIGKGKWNGFGGKVEPNETIDDAAIREVKEECGLDVISIEKIGIIEFEYSGSKELLEGHIYLCKLFSGEIIESDEMAPIKWYKIEDTPCDKMWIDHKFWFPMIQKQIPFKAHFKYLNDDTMLDSTIVIISNSMKKSRKTFVNFVIKKENQILLCNKIEGSKCLLKHKPVRNGESIENSAIRYLEWNYGMTAEQFQKIAVVDIEFIDDSCTQEIYFFVVDVTKLINTPLIEDSKWVNISDITVENLWPDYTFLSKLLMMEPFKAYFLINEDNILCSKYYNN